MPVFGSPFIQTRYDTNTDAVAAAIVNTQVGALVATNMNGSNNLDLVTWQTYQASHLSDYNNLGRYSWTNTINKLRLGQTIRVQMDGSGLMQYVPIEIVTNLLPQAPISGFSTIFYPWVYGANHGTSQFITASANGAFDPWSFAPYFLLTNNQAAMSIESAVTFPWNVLSITFGVFTNSGTVAIGTNNGIGGTFATALTVNLKSYNTNAVTVLWTNTGPIWSQVDVSNTTTGTNYVLNVGLLNTTITNGVIFGSFNNTSTSVSNIYRVSTNVSGPLYRSLNPDLVIAQTIESYTANSNNFPKLINFYRTWIPNADVVCMGTYFTQSDPGGSSDVGATNQNFAIFSACEKSTPAAAYFDVTGPFGGTNVEALRGMFVGTDGTHLFPAFPIWSYWLSRWLNLSDDYYRNANAQIVSAPSIDAFNATNLFAAYVTNAPSGSLNIFPCNNHDFIVEYKTGGAVVANTTIFHVLYSIPTKTLVMPTWNAIGTLSQASQQIGQVAAFIDPASVTTNGFWFYVANTTVGFANGGTNDVHFTVP